MEGDQNVDELSKERSAKLVKTWPYIVARYAHVTLARDHVRLCNITKITHFQYYKTCPFIVLKDNTDFKDGNYKASYSQLRELFPVFEYILIHFENLIK